MYTDFAISPLQGVAVPTYSGQWKGKPLTIRLDNSAVMKLEGNAPVQAERALPLDAEAKVALAARRLLEMRQADHKDGELVVVMTALDLD